MRTFISLHREKPCRPLIIMLDLDIKIASKTRQLALLTGQAERTRAELLRLRNEVAHAQRDLDKVHKGFLAACNNHVRDANERLVIAALESATKVESVGHDFDKLSRSSQRDALTDTPNRALMLDRIEIAITNAHRRGNQIGIIFVDIDKFKSINDTLGHSVGDDMVQLVASRLQSVVRGADTVSRHSGDEFLILLSDISKEADAGLIAQKIIAAITLPFYTQGHTLNTSVSMGIAIYPQDGAEAKTLIDRADQAMYLSKRSALGGFRFYQ